jgi:hypothetical protein
MRHLEMADGEVRGAQHGRDAREPMVGVWLVEHEIAGEYQVEAHLKLVSKFN